MGAKYYFIETLREIRFLFCQTSEHSAATRSFLARAYPIMKKNNPTTPILIRDAAGTHPMIFARYKFGHEKKISLMGFSEKEVQETVKFFVRTGT